jgi:hypothetical protein
MSATDQPFSLVVADLASEAGVSVLAGGITELVTADFYEVEAETAFREVAQQVGLAAVYTDGIVSFRKPGGIAEQFAVFSAGYLSNEDVGGALKLVLGGEGESKFIGQRVLVSGSDEAVQRAREVLDQFQTGPDGWLLQVALVEVSESFRRDLGIGWNVGAAGRLDARADWTPVLGHPEMPFVGAGARVLVEAVAQAADLGRDAQVLTVGTLFLLEGTPTEMQNGDVVPVPQRQTSPEGTVRVVGYDKIATGFTVRADGHRVPEGLLLSINPKYSTVTGFVEDAPIVAERSISGTAVMRSGDWMVLSGLDASALRRSTTGVPGMPASYFTSSESRTAESGSMLVLVRAVRVFSGGSDDPIPSVVPGGVDAPGPGAGGLPGPGIG